MNFNKHPELEGRHAFLSASKYHWIRYSDEKLDASFVTAMAAMKGTELHNFAAEAIRLGIKLTNNQKTLNRYINDAIGFRMIPEQVLAYSGNAFGTADAISFKKNFLRIHDLKTGVTPSKMDQLQVYTALFCLEYRLKPGDIGVELRIYQNDEVEVYTPEVDDIAHIMDKIVHFDRRIEILRAEALA